MFLQGVSVRGRKYMVYTAPSASVRPVTLVKVVSYPKAQYPKFDGSMGYLLVLLSLTKYETILLS